MERLAAYHQVARLLGTYPEAVRFLSRKGWLANFGGLKQLLVSRVAVEEFNKEYIFAGVLAKQWNLNPTTLAEKLMALGAKAVSGPLLDGALVYLFRREEVECLDPDVLRNLTKYPTNAGMKPKATYTQTNGCTNGTVTAVDAAVMLGISVQQLRVLFKKGVLKRADTLGRAVKVDRASLEKLQATLGRQDMITDEDAAARLNLLPAMFYSRWVKRGVIEMLDLGWWRLVKLSDLEKLRGKLYGRVTAAEAGELLGTHPSYFPAMEKRGEVSGIKVGTKHGGVRLYNLHDVERLRGLLAS